MKILGLTDDQVRESRDTYGNNSLTEVKTESFWGKLRSNFGDPMIRILCVALAINIAFAFLGETKWYESLGIAVAVVLATFVSTFSEYRNENAFQKLQEEASLIVCKLYRNGEIVELPINDIVVGDCILLQSGDKIPADGVLVDGSLKVDQSVLNGETKEANKSVMPAQGAEDAGGATDAGATNATATADAVNAQATTAAIDTASSTVDPANPDASSTSTVDPANPASMDFLNPYKVFRGAVVVSGNAVMQVSVAGDQSVYGQIARELQDDDDRDSPLKVKLTSLANGIAKFGYIGGTAIALAFLFDRIVINNGFDLAAISVYCSSWTTILLDLVDAVMLAVIIIVMAVPEGLPLMIAIVSALNMGKMLKDNVLVRKVAGIETAGSLNILFSDKTGTITKGQLEAVVFVDGVGAEHRSYKEVLGELQRLLHLSIYHNTNAVISRRGEAVNIVGGNATERAVLGFVTDGRTELELAKIATIPFNSENKYSATTVAGDLGGLTHAGILSGISHNSQDAFHERADAPHGLLTMIKGAPEIVLARCRTYYDETGRPVPLTDRTTLESRIDALAARAIRVLAIAISSAAIEGERLPEGDWTLVGIIGIRDEVRPESITAIAEVLGAGVQVVMITGDRKDTAVAIAREAGLLTSESDLVLTSGDLAAMDDAAVTAALPAIRVVARALPSDKSRLVRLAQELNLVAGMTGDGVNDSPALKKADVGFSMGGGTEVAKEASDIVILDDNFSSIDKAILYGRTIFNSIRKFIIFQLTINVGAVMICFVAPLMGIEAPLTIIQILWINLVMDTLAALAFGGEPALRRFMAEQPKRRDEPIVSPTMWSAILTCGLWALAVSLVFLFSPLLTGFFRPEGGKLYLMTGFFALFIFMAVFNAFNARTEKLNLFDNLAKNKGFLQVIALIVVIQVALIYLGGAVFDCFGLTPIEFAIVIGLSVLIIPIDLARKAILAVYRHARQG
ncbi:MAG: cation-translocating P-type ATPase [Coriobacteriales bacterium]|jgi:magnesium-transporting ATPase (P-type)|nr:cation-translocating P-type ATPase [Coriobacteriales bacterium]